MEKYNIKVDFKNPISIDIISAEIIDFDTNEIEIGYISTKNQKVEKIFLEKRTMGPILSMRFLPIGIASGLFLYTSIIYEKSETLQTTFAKMSTPTMLIFMLLGGLLLQAIGFLLGSRSVTHVLKYQTDKDSSAHSILIMNTNEKIKDKVLKTLTKFKPEKIDIKPINREAKA